MATLRKVCTIRDRRLLSLRSLSERRQASLLKYPELVPAGMLIVNLCACGYFEHEVLGSEEAAGAFFLIESVLLSTLLFLHGIVVLGGVVDRARFLGVPSGLRFLFVELEFGTHRTALAQLGGMLLVWISLFFRALPVLLLILLASLAWYTSIVVCTTLIYLLSVRWRIHPAVLAGTAAAILFVVLTGPMVLAGGSPYALLPISGWTARAFTEALQGRAGSALLWLVPTLTAPVVFLPFAARRG